MKPYTCPITVNMALEHFSLTQSLSGGLLTPLTCNGDTGQCNAGVLGAECNCANSVLNITFLVPGADCADIHNGADCSIFPACLNPEIEATQCSTGCVIDIGCDAQGGCAGVDYTVSCPGFDDCSANAGANVC